MALFLNINTVLAEITVKEYTYSWDSEQADIPLQKISENCYIFNCDGIDYIYSELSDTSPIRYNKDEADFLLNNLMVYIIVMIIYGQVNIIWQDFTVQTAFRKATVDTVVFL